MGNFLQLIQGILSINNRNPINPLLFTFHSSLKRDNNKP